MEQIVSEEIIELLKIVKKVLISIKMLCRCETSTGMFLVMQFILVIICVLFNNGCL